MNSLEEFKDKWLSSGMPWRPPFKNAIHVTDIAYAICVFRDGPYQVELYICKPNTETPVHSHPGVQSISMYLTGDLQFSRGNSKSIDLSKYQNQKQDGTHMLLGKISEVNQGGEEHSLKIGNPGGALLIFEYWENGNPESVSTNWQGELIGDLHKKTIEAKNVEFS